MSPIISRGVLPSTSYFDTSIKFLIDWLIDIMLMIAFLITVYVDDGDDNDDDDDDDDDQLIFSYSLLFNSSLQSLQVSIH